MVDNRDVKAANDYHEATKLAYINLRNKPPLYKSYDGVPKVPLPTDFASPEVATLEAVGRQPDREMVEEGVQTPTLHLADIAKMLYYSAGLLHRRVLPVAGEVHYRAAASAGALYPVEVYLVTGDAGAFPPSIKAGVYHFSPEDFTLAQLRAGDYRQALAAAAGGAADVANAPVTLVFTSVFWRSAWKYRVRSYRYCLWDTGTILANLLATVKGGDRLAARVIAGFVDRQVNNLLRLDQQREASICLVPIGASENLPEGNRPSQAEVEALTDERVLLTPGTDGEIDYPEITLAHTASCLGSDAEVLSWRQNVDVKKDCARSGPDPVATPEALPLSPDFPGLQSAALGETIFKRGSTRRFARESISKAQFNAILETSTSQVPADFLSASLGNQGNSSLLRVYTIANAVEGMTAGAYHFSPEERRLELLKAGDFREEAGHLCFEQALGADASAVFYFLADLDLILERYGNRGYRAAQLEAGVMVGNAYLCSHSLGLGATGMTFYDDDVTEFFSPHAKGMSMMFLVAVGPVDPVNRVRPFRSRVGVLLDSLARGAGGARPFAGPSTAS